MRVLFIGGTGVISSACSRLAVEKGMELFLLNRGESLRPVPEEAHVLRGDIRDSEEVTRSLRGLQFDCVVDWIAYTDLHAQADIELFRDCTKHYVFISSTSVYQTPPATLPVTEEMPLGNPYWPYARGKISCEVRLMEAYRNEGFPLTIVRPSHTYDQTKVPLQGGYTMVERMRRGSPVIVHGDGTSLRTLTHHRDFARGFVGLLGNSRAIGEVFHIGSDELLTWNQIYQIIARSAGADVRVVHVPSDVIAAYDPVWGASLLGDKAHSMIFDYSKIKQIAPSFAASIPFSEGAMEILCWFDADPRRRTIDTQFDQQMDRIIAAQESALPK